jgi:hypothetical protein
VRGLGKWEPVIGLYVSGSHFPRSLKTGTTYEISGSHFPRSLKMGTTYKITGSHFSRSLKMGTTYKITGSYFSRPRGSSVSPSEIAMAASPPLPDVKVLFTPEIAPTRTIIYCTWSGHIWSSYFSSFPEFA